MIKSFCITKNSETTFTYRPENKILHEEFINWVENDEKFTWFKDTEHGKKLFRYRELPKFLGAYLNYNPIEEKSYVQFDYSKKGVISVEFEFKLIYDTLVDLHNFVIEKDCVLWHDKTKKKVDMTYIKKLF